MGKRKGRNVVMVEVIPKDSNKVSLGTYILPLGGALILAAAIFSFVFINSMKAKAETEVDALQESVNKGKSEAVRAIESELRKSQKQIQGFEFAAARRESFIPFFEFLEKTTHENVFFTNLSIDVDGLSLLVNGVAPDFETIEEQRLIWRTDKSVERVEISQVEFSDEGGRKFQADVTLASDWEGAAAQKVNKLAPGDAPPPELKDILSP